MVRGESSRQWCVQVLQQVVVRHTKAQHIAGEQILQLPDKEEHDVEVRVGDGCVCVCVCVCVCDGCW